MGPDDFCPCCCNVREILWVSPKGEIFWAPCDLCRTWICVDTLNEKGLVPHKGTIPLGSVLREADRKLEDRKLERRYRHGG